MLVMSKQRRAPSSDAASSEEIRARRSSRRRSKRMRSSQSTPIVPYVWSPIGVTSPSICKRLQMLAAATPCCHAARSLVPGWRVDGPDLLGYDLQTFAGDPGPGQVDSDLV